MKFDTEGTYTLQYKAVDECGNETTEDREVEVYTVSTVLYSDGTFIINEKSTDRESNIAEHGAISRTYVAWTDSPAADASRRYDFRNVASASWSSKASSIVRVEIGSPIKPVSLAKWFTDASNLKTVDFELMDTSLIESLDNAFQRCSSLQDASFLASMDAKSLTSALNTFDGCSQLKRIEFSGKEANGLQVINNMFSGCSSLEYCDFSNNSFAQLQSANDLFSGDTSMVECNLEGTVMPNINNAIRMFQDCRQVQILDLAGLNMGNLTQFQDMFRICWALTTIYASSNISSTTTPTSLFYDCSNKLKGGEGTVWSSSYTKSDYARIDNPPDAPGYFTLKQA